MRIYNTMERQKTEFVPMKEKEARIYVCGPTVYNFIHIGNARPLCVFDTLRRYLTFKGYNVIFVSNVTDIDDKLISAASAEGTTVQDIAQRYEKEYLKDADGLNVLRPTIMPRATEHMQDIIKLIEKIIENGYGYVAVNGDVYFRARKFEDYGKLSHMALDDLENARELSGGALGDGLKEHSADFAVWKSAKPDEPAWDSPWGKGRPGWHIECSAMAEKHLGATLDIHAGGQDLVFPHHENEIAQSESANKQTFARYWMHNGFLNIDNRKMSKSLGNFFTVREISDQIGYEPIRYFMISAHYRAPLNFSMDILKQSEASLERLYTCRENLEFALKNSNGKTDEQIIAKAQDHLKQFCDRMDDDLNTADALASLFDLVRDINTLASVSSRTALEKAGEVFDSMCEVLGLLYNMDDGDIAPEVQKLAEERAEARKNKEWQKADELRAKIDEMGYVVEDTPEGPKISKK